MPGDMLNVTGSMSQNIGRAPVRAAGFMMGIWFLATSLGNWLAGEAATLYSSMPLPTLFGTVAAFTLAAAVLLAVLIKPTERLMSGVK